MRNASGAHRIAFGFAARACAAAALLLALAARAEDAPLSPKLLREALAAKPSGAEAETLAERIRAWFGKEKIAKGADAKTDQLDAAWAVELAEAKTPVKVVASDGAFVLPLARVGESNIYAGAAELPEGAAFRWKFEVDGQPFGGGQLEVYRAHPDALPQPGVPKGELRAMPKWKSAVFEGTERDWWLYLPAQLKPGELACVMVFQDGNWMKDYAPVAMDNLIAKGEMPVTVGVFIAPGVFEGGKSNRSVEYDTLSDKYARFLLEEMLPETEKAARLRQDAASRAITGLSSGGICSWTVAWERPEEFGRVASWIGSFTNIASGDSKREGGHNYPALIRKTDKKPIRIFLQDGENDLDNVHGNWPLANQEMARALEFKGYDMKFVYGRGFHSDKHCRAILPDAMRWLWRPEE